MRKSGVSWIGLLFVATLGVGGTPKPIVSPSVDHTPVTRQDFLSLYREMDARYKELHNMLEDALAAQARLTRQVQNLEQRLTRLEARVDSLMTLTNRSFLHPEDLKPLLKAIEELKRQRTEDLKFIKQRLQTLAKVLQQSTAAPKPPPPKSSPKPRYTRGYEYVVQPGDTLSAIIQAYRKEGVKVTLKMVLEANPGLNPELIHPGQKIFIPDPRLNK